MICFPAGDFLFKGNTISSEIVLHIASLTLLCYLSTGKYLMSCLVSGLACHTFVLSAVFTGHLVYACVVVALIFRNDNSFIKKSLILLSKHLRKHNLTLFLNVWPLKLWKHISIWRELEKNRKNNVYKNGNKIAIFGVF